LDEDLVKPLDLLFTEDQTMRAIRYEEYGSADVLRMVDIDTPQPGADEVLLCGRAASVNPLDWHYMRGTPYLLQMQSGLRRPSVKGLGVNIAGDVVAVGENVHDFKPGDAVFGGARGSFANYVCTPSSKVIHKPRDLSFEQAAALPVAGRTALQALRDKWALQARQRVSINGAAGGVDTFAVQIAKAMGAHVTAVCSARNVAIVQGIGADHVIDYAITNFTQGNGRFDMLIDNIGNHGLAACRRVLTSGGTMLLVSGRDGRWLGPTARLAAAKLLAPFVSQKLALLLTNLRGTADLEYLRKLHTAGKLTSVIDRTYDLAQTAEAMRYLEARNAQG
jgi:NADPH:quinone reductase-like Zn-dependent oxidoreductase